MKVKIFCFTATILLILYTSLACNAQSIRGRLVHYKDFTSKYVQSRNVYVWLPENYDPHNKYAVLYMHDGQSLFDTVNSFNRSEWKVDETLSKLIGENKIRPCIVVGIWNTGKTRKAEYFPQKALDNLAEEDRMGFLPMLEGGAKADEYLKFIVHELKPFIDSNFSTLRNREHTFIAGSSMGGLISLYAICEYPSLFGGAACLSTHWTGNYKTVDNPIPFAIIQYLENNLPASKNHKIYFDYGSLSLDSMYKPFQSKVDIIMHRHGYTSRNWITKEFIGESHTEEAWSRRFYIPATFLMHK